MQFRVHENAINYISQKSELADENAIVQYKFYLKSQIYGEKEEIIFKYELGQEEVYNFLDDVNSKYFLLKMKYYPMEEEFNSKNP